MCLLNRFLRQTFLVSNIPLTFISHSTSHFLSHTPISFTTSITSLLELVLRFSPFLLSLSVCLPLSVPISIHRTNNTSFDFVYSNGVCIWQRWRSSLMKTTKMNRFSSGVHVVARADWIIWSKRKNLQNWENVKSVFLKLIHSILYESEEDSSSTII